MPKPKPTPPPPPPLTSIEDFRQSNTRMRRVIQEAADELKRWELDTFPHSIPSALQSVITNLEDGLTRPPA